MNALLILLVLLVVQLLFDLILRRFALKGLQCSRRFSVPCAFEGDSVEVIEVVRNDRPLFVPWLRLESRISPHLRFGRLENLDVLRKVKKLWGPMDDYFMQAHGGLFLLSGAIDDLPEEEFPEHFGMTKQDFEDEYGD